MMIPELLAPAGSFEHMKAAINAGADAVYMGGKMFGARAYAANLSDDEIIPAINYAHLRGKKLYLTVNTLVKEPEMAYDLKSYLTPYVNAGIDAVIVQDPGVVTLIREQFPALPIHASTQMTITDVSGCIAASEQGICRIVPARELSLSELKRMKEQLPEMELEVFIHGALCVCYSGQCLFSAMYGGRSGNRGKCAQPCRLPYQLYDKADNLLHTNGKHLLSPRDLCGLEALPEIVNIGIDSLKIEGRMKSIEYVAGVTAIYRRYLDKIAETLQNSDYSVLTQNYHVAPSDISRLEELYVRDHFTDGYFFRHNGQNMMSVIHPKNTGRLIGKVENIKGSKATIKLDPAFYKNDAIHARDVLIIFNDRQEETVLTVPASAEGSPAFTLNLPNGSRLSKGMKVYRRYNHQYAEQIKSNYIDLEKKTAVDMKISLHIGQPAELFIKSILGKEIRLYGDPVDSSIKKPISDSDVLRQMNKTGNVPFYVNSCDIDLDKNAFYPMSKLKSLRQDAFDALEKSILSDHNQITETVSEANTAVSVDLPSEGIFITVHDKNTLEVVLKLPDVTGIVLPLDSFDPENIQGLSEQIHSMNKEVYLSLPRIIRGEERTHIDYKEICARISPDGVYVHNINEASMMKGYPGQLIASSFLYGWNRSAVDHYRTQYGICASQMPLEYDFDDIRDLLCAYDPDGLPCFEMQLFGRVPLMVSAQCVKMTTGRCDGIPDLLYLKDHKGRMLPVTTHCRQCYNTIWKDQPFDLRNDIPDDIKNRIKRWHIDVLPMDVDMLVRR